MYCLLLNYSWKTNWPKQGETSEVLEWYSPEQFKFIGWLRKVNWKSNCTEWEVTWEVLWSSLVFDLFTLIISINDSPDVLLDISSWVLEWGPVWSFT